MNHRKRLGRHTGLNLDTKRRRLRQECLEPRHLLALDVSFESGLLDIRAVDNEDIIVTAETNMNGSALVKINGRQLDSSPLAAADVVQIRAIGGLFSYIDLSAARDNDEAFSSLRETVESEPDDSWRIDFQPINSVLEKIYVDPVARSQGLSWTEKVARLETWVGDLEGTARQHPVITRFDPLSQSAGAEGGGGMAAASSSFDGGIVDIVPLVEQPEYVDWMSFTVSHRKTPGSSARFAFNGMSVNYTVSNGSAVSPEDYVPQAVPSLPLEWMDGEEGQSRVISIDIEQDMIWEGDEDLQVTLSGLVNFSGDEGEATLGNSQATGVIENDDPVPTVSIVLSASVNEDEGPALLTVSLSNPSSLPITVNWTTEDQTATSGSDFNLGQPVMFAPGASPQPLTVPIVNDNVFEPTETFLVQLTNATNATVSPSANEAQVTIVDDDPELGSIGDFVWDDLNWNGIQDADEPGIANVQIDLVQLINETPQVVATTTSDASGAYLFSDLAAGTYIVLFTAPIGFVETAFQVGNDVTIDSDADLNIVNLGAGEDNDTIDGGMVNITDADFELTAYRPQSEQYGAPINRRDVPDAEEEDPGVYIRRNGDDDDNDSVADNVDNSVAGENDLIEVVLAIDAASGATGEYLLRRTTTDLKVWDSKTKGAAILDAANEAVIDFGGASTITVWVEWVSTDSGASTSALESHYRLNAGVNSVVRDRIDFQPFVGIVIVLGGEFQTPSDPPLPGEDIYQVAFDLYEDGHDVHMYDEDDVDGSGLGPVYDEVVSAIQSRGVTKIAIMGYSHGGGSTWDLSNVLNVNRGSIGTFSIEFTAYVDGVTTGSITQETRLPPGTLWHLSLYQNGSIEDGFLDGGPVVGANENINVEDSPSWNLDVTHRTIDDNTDVLDWVKLRFGQHFPQR